MSWFTSWLPALPPLPSLNISLPTSIQSRFLSFILRKALGHFLKPGQLEASQIESQIGSGNVHVANLELDSQAFNQYLSGLPAGLHSGRVGLITARIPWPNPLTSVIGFSVKSLHLTFHLLPKPKQAASHVADLAESVVSVAESFVQEELSPSHKSTIPESYHNELAASLRDGEFSLPGGLGGRPGEEQQADVDPAGVSIFATMIEGLLARFEFDAEDTRITLVHSGHASITFTLAELRYRTENSAPEDAGSKTRSVTLSGLTITAKDLAPVSDLSSSSTSQATQAAYSSMSVSTLQTPRRSPSPTSSSSSLDEETHMAMSQSLAFLPSRPASPASSVASSMYQSARSLTSTQHEQTTLPDPFEAPNSGQDRAPDITPDVPPLAYSQPEPPISQPAPGGDCRQHPANDDLVLSFGKQSIVLRLVTPPPTPRRHTEEEGRDVAYEETLKFSASIGVLACAFRAWHLRCVMDMVETLSSHSSPPKMESEHPSSTVVKMDASATMRGIVVLFLPSPSELETPFSADQLEAFFDKPLLPPRLSIAYVRAHIERISLGGLLLPRPPDRIRKSAASSISLASFEVTIDDLSLFVFEAMEEHTKDLAASPIIITDPHLSGEYPSTHAHPDPIVRTGVCPPMPVFDIIDWTDPKHHVNGMRLSQWRVKSKSEDKAFEGQRAVLLTFEQKSLLDKKQKRQHLENDITISSAPLHVFANLRQLVNVHVLGFVEELTRPSKEHKDPEVIDDTGDSDENETGSDSLDEAFSMPSGDMQQAVELERRRLERLVLKDLDLDYDYGLRDSPMTIGGAANFRRKSKAKANTNKLSVFIPMVRLQIRCPPPFGQAPRSGPLIFDIHGINIFNGPRQRPSGARFADDPAAGDVTAIIQLRRLLVATAGPTDVKALAVASVGSLTGLAAGDEDGVSLTPVVSLFKSPSNPSKNLIAVQVPSAYVNIHKVALDAIQYALDDASQLIEVTFGTSQPDAEKMEGREGSIIGSRFFVKSRAGSDCTVGGASTRASDDEPIGTISVTELFVRLNLPNVPVSSDEVQMSMDDRPIVFHETKPTDMYASDVVVELRPDGKDETAIVASVMDLNIKNATPSGTFDTLLQLTVARSLTAKPQPLLKLHFKSLVVPETTAKESRVKLILCGFTLNFHSDVRWVQALVDFFKAPPGAFESVVPTECTRVAVRVVNGSIAAFTPNYPGCLVVHFGDLEFGTTVIGGSSDAAFRLSVPSLALLLIDNTADIQAYDVSHSSRTGFNYWKKIGFALLAEVNDLAIKFEGKPNDTRVIIERIGLRLHLCADTASALAAFIADMTAVFQPPPHEQPPKSKRGPAMLSEKATYGLGSLDDDAFRRPPELGPAPDMIYDDLPSNLDFLDDSYSAAAGLRELRDDDLEDFDVGGTTNDVPPADQGGVGVTSTIGGETIKMLRPDIQVIENHFDNLPPEPTDGSTQFADTTMHVQIVQGDIFAFLYDGYDWVRTRRTIEEGVKEMRKRLAKIRQLVANGQTQDPALEEETNTLLYNSVFIGLEQDVDELEPGALLAAIDEELRDDFETVSQSSWQSLKPQTAAPKAAVKVPRVQGKRLTRARGPNIEFRLAKLRLNIDKYVPESSIVSKIFATIEDLEILDHMKSSTWSKFLTSLRSDSHGNIRETGSNMARVELKNLHPVPGHPSVEARLRAKILPLRLHVDQDALDFLKRFFSFEDPQATPSSPKDPDDDIYFQSAEIFPVDLKLDYKPRRVDYRALKEGKTIELMNFFHFDGAEMTLRHIHLAGISGWPRMFGLLNDLWTPDVKATQLVEVISGVAPIRSMVNVGSGIADLVLLPISQYKKDGRIVRGVQKGATAFVKSTAIEAIKLGARLATGTQVILEQAEGVIGGQFDNTITAETLQSFGEDVYRQESEEDAERFSKYAEQPADIKEGMQSAYRSLHRNLNSAAQTILAVPMEVYERSGNEGPVRSVIRAVPIAVLRPMIGASEAVSKTLLGLHNTLDPNVRQDNQAKYKQR